MCRRSTESTEDWLRVIRNIIENGPNIGKDNFADAVALIDELAPNRENIINHLAHKKIESRFANEQLQEEWEKAKQIIASQNNQCEGPQKEEILVAEEFAFFNGAIRFLYTDADGKTNWSQFKQKFENAKLYFNKSGVTEDYRVEAKLLRAFLAKFEDINFWFGNGKNFWRRTLLDKNYIAGVDSLLNGELNIPDDAKLWLTNNTLIDDATVGDGDRDAQWCIQKNWNGFETLTRYARKESRTIKNPRQVIPLSDWRARVLQSLGVGDNECTSQRRGGKYFIDWVTEFEYKGVKIKLVEGNPKSVFLNGESVEDKDVQDEFKKLAGEAYLDSDRD